MKEKINRLARGIPDQERPEIRIVPDRLEAEIRRGELYRTEILLESGSNAQIRGFVLSDSPRTRFPKTGFAGARIRIPAEFDARFLESGDNISGEVLLITNAGEHKIPFAFRITDGTVGNTLDHLKTEEDFAMIAKADPESALRIFEYNDFVSAPFMQKEEIRALYEAFREGPDRASAMEQFLIARRLKEPVRVSAEEEMIQLKDSDTEDGVEILLTASCEGCLRLKVSAEGSFLSSYSELLTEKDFENGSCMFHFAVDREKLHAGENTGRFLFSAPAGSFEVGVSVRRTEDSPEGLRRKQRLEEEQHFSEYMKMRIRAALDSLPEQKVIRLSEELRGAGSVRESDPALRLREAEAQYLAGDENRMRELLFSVAQTVTENRTVMKTEYALFEGLRALLPEYASRRDGAVRIVKKYLEEEGAGYLLPLLLHLTPELRDQPAAFYELLTMLYEDGMRSPFLYAELWKLYQNTPEFLKIADDMEFSVLRFALDYTRVSKNQAARFADAAGEMRNYTAVRTAMLRELYEKQPSEKLLSVILIGMIRLGADSTEDFEWYLEGVRNDQHLTGLYEHLAVSMPQDYGEALPHEVYLYYSFGTRTDPEIREKIYANLLRFREDEAQLYAEYKDQIENFVFNCLLEKKIDPCLTVLYHEVLSPDMIDLRLAEILPDLLTASRICTENKDLRRVIGILPELTEILSAEISGGNACLSEDTAEQALLFEDKDGNRYADISYTRVPLLPMPELLERCLILKPDSRAALLNKLRAVLLRIEAGEQPGYEDITVLKRAYTELPLSGPTERRILKIFASDPKNALDLLNRTSPSRFEKAERIAMMHAFYDAGRYQDAYRLLSGTLNIPGEAYTGDLIRLTILENKFKEDPVLLKLAAEAFAGGVSDPVIMDYLCAYYSGSAEKTFRLLTKAAAADVETYDLEERLLSQMLFTGETAFLDDTFRLYRERKRASELIVRAYMTNRAEESFRNGTPLSGGTVRYLEMLTEQAGDDPGRLPVIYLLALSLHYAKSEKLSESEARTAEAVLSALLDAGLCFPYYKNLARFIHVPQEITDKAMLEFRGKEDARYAVRVKIVPAENAAHIEEPVRMYGDLYVFRTILFAGETLCYEVIEKDAEGIRVILKGTLEGDAVPAESGTRIARLNRMTALLAERRDAELKEEMNSFLKDGAMAVRLFGLRS